MVNVEAQEVWLLVKAHCVGVVVVVSIRVLSHEVLGGRQWSWHWSWHWSRLESNHLLSNEAGEIRSDILVPHRHTLGLHAPSSPLEFCSKRTFSRLGSPPEELLGAKSLVSARGVGKGQGNVIWREKGVSYSQIDLAMPYPAPVTDIPCKETVRTAHYRP